MNVPLFVAWRYFFAKKSHNVINIVSAISAAGMAIGTAALIIILSVYNGFDSLIRSMLDGFEPDYVVCPAEGKSWVPSEQTCAELLSDSRIESIAEIVEENVFVSYGGRQTMARIKGVDKAYEINSGLENYLCDGVFSLHRGDVPLACVGAGLAIEMGINPRFVNGLELYFPSRTKKVSMASPMASVQTQKVYPSGVFAVNADIDKDYLIIPVEVARRLLDYENEVTSLQVRLAPGTSERESEKIRDILTSKFGDDFIVKDRFMQNESLYKMMAYEKMAIYMILIFVVIIVAFSIFGCLTMLIIEKTEDIGTFRSLGAPDAMIRRIFRLEGWMITLIGLVIGLVIGVAFVLAQQHFGFIPLPGNFAVSAYPVDLQWKDLAITTVGVASIGYLIAVLPSLRIREN